MKAAAWLVAALLAASGAGAADAPPPPADSADAPKPPAKPKLGGGFKGIPTTPPGTATAPAPKPAAPPAKAAGKTTPRIVIDNSLVKKNAAPESGKSAGSASRTSAPAPPPPPVVMPRITDLEGHDETYWRAKASSMRAAVAKAETDLAAAEAEEKREENDFYAWDDGNYRDNVIKPAWDKAREETVRARDALDAARKDLDGLDDEARKAGAYPGWIRE